MQEQGKWYLENGNEDKVFLSKVLKNTYKLSSQLMESVRLSNEMDDFIG